MGRGFTLIDNERYEELVACEARVSVVADMAECNDYVSADDVFLALGFLEEVKKRKEKEKEAVRKYNEKIKNGEILHV